MAKPLRNESSIRDAYERNLARFRPGQAWANGSSCFRILEGPINHPMYLWDDDGKGDYMDRLALRVEPLPSHDDVPEGGVWVDESCFPYLRLMVDVSEAAA